MSLTFDVLNLKPGKRTCFFAQSTDSHGKSTSLMRTLHYELCALIDNSFFESKKPSVDTDVPACSQYQTNYVENVRHGFDR